MGIANPLHPPTQSCLLHRVPYRIVRRGVVRKSCEWVLEKKEHHRHQGKEVRPDTQYTGCKCKPHFQAVTGYLIGQLGLHTVANRKFSVLKCLLYQLTK